MKALAWVVAGLAILGVVSGGCGGQGPVEKAVEKPGEVGQSLTYEQMVYRPPSQGGVLPYAGTGVRGCLDGNLATATFNDPAAVLPLNDANSVVAVADWGCNTIRQVMPTQVITDLQVSPNLLVNSRAELGAASPIVGWTVPKFGGNWSTTSSPCSDCGEPADGNRFFYAGNTATDAILYQDVDLGPNFVANSFCFSGLVRSYNEANPDSTQVEVKSLDATGAAIPGKGAITSLATFTGNWSPVELQWTVPTGARKIRVLLKSKRNGCSTCSNDGYFDELQLRQGSCQGWYPDRPRALARTVGGILVGGKGLCYWHFNTFFSCDAQYQNTYVQALAISGNRAYVASTTLGVGYVALDAATGAPTGPIVKLTLPGGSLLGFANGLAVQKVDVLPGNPPQDELYVASGWQPDPVQNASLGQRIHRYFCSATGAQCEVSASSRPTPGFLDGGPGVSPPYFRRPSGLAMGRFGDFLVADTGNHAVRRSHRVSFATTIGGNGTPGNSGNGGLSINALFNEPSGVGMASNGDVYVADRGNNQIRKIVCAGNDICATTERFDPATSACVVSSSRARDDANDCTYDDCYVIAVMHRPASDATPCPDGNLCNGAETCQQGLCKPGIPIATQEQDDGNPCTVDSCDFALGVRHQARPAGAACSNGDVCALPGTCNASSVCVPGAAMPTDDGNECTTDSCGASGVTHALKAVGTSCGNATGKCDASGACIPNNLGSLNPGAIDRTLPTPPNKLFADFLGGNGGGQTGSTACVYDAANPTCAFIPTHMALVRGTVADVNGTGLAGVTVSALNHPEFGSTLSLANGEYFFVVNGGAPLTIRAAKTGFLGSDRLVNPPWGGTDFAQDVVLIALDSKVTTVTFSAGGIVSGSVTPANYAGDNSPARAAAVYFPPNVGATTNGVALPATAKFRVTEYTAGANGQNRMPANVAANTMYTYAAEFTLEDTSGNRYDNVTFAKPVMSYVDNFLNLDVSETVPVGYYDRQAGNWQPMPNGRVIAVDSAGVVTGLQASDPVITPDELAKLAVYKNKTLWRLPLQHFSPLDFNMGIGAPSCETENGTTVCPGAVEAEATGGDDGPACGSCQKTGSIIDVERQVLRETFPLVGTPFSLNYSSENTLGFAANKVLGINFESHPKHSKLKSYVIDFYVAGKRVVTGGLFKDVNGNWPKGYQAVWDGRDQDGRSVQGQVTATLAVGAVYPAVPTRVVSFGGASSSGGHPTSVVLAGTRQDPDIIFWKHHHKQLQVWDASALGFGGWTINAHHTFDPVGNVLYLGDGTHRKVDTTGGGVVSLVAGGVVAPGASPDGTAAASAAFKNIQGLAVGRDGDVFVAIPSSHVVRKIGVANGQYTTVRDYAGKSELEPATLPSGSVAAVSANLKKPVSIALHDDGRLVVADYDAHRVYEVSADGATLRPIAGTGDPCSGSVITPWVDGSPAKNVPLCNVQAVATGSDGSTYFANASAVGTRSYVARIDPAGGLWHIAGTLDTAVIPPTRYAMLAPGTTGRQIALVAAGIAVDRNNTVFLSVGYEVVAVPVNGPIRVYSLPDSARTYIHGDGLIDFTLFGDGAFLMPGDNHTLNRCTAAGCSVVGGIANSWDTNTVLDAPAVGNKMMTGSENFGVAVGPDGSIFLGQTQINGMGARIIRISGPVVAPGAAAACVYKVPSASGSEYYCFDERGQHRSTVDTLTNGTIRTFGYDSSGLLTSITEGATALPSRTTTIDRATPGVVKIISPTSQSTQITLESTKKQYATSIAGAGTITPTHDLNNGLLTALTDVNNQPHAFNYDGLGRLQKDTDGANGFQRLTRTDTASGKYTVAVTTALGKTDWFSREVLSNGNEQRVFGLLNGLTSTTVRDGAGTNSTTLADGTILSQTPGSGPIWGMLAPFTAATSFTAGSNSVSTTRTITVNNGIRTDQTKVIGATTRTYEQIYSTTNKTLTLKSPAGRQIVYTLDPEGRVASIQPPGVPQIDLTINATTGRLDRIKQGTGRVVDLTYSSSGANKGFLTAISDPYVSPTPSLSTTFAPDANGRPLSTTRQSVATQFDWFADGQLKWVTPPGQAAHQLGYDARGILNTYTPPTLGGTDEKTTFGTDLDRFLYSVDAPGWDDLHITTDPTKGRTTSLLVGGQSIDFAYYGAFGDASCTTGCAPGHLSSITDNRSGSAIVTSFAWQKSLPTSISHGGGTTTWTYDNDIRRTSEAFSKSGHSTSTVTLGYDADGLLTCASLGTCASGQTEKLAIARETASGRLTGLTLGTGPTETWGYNGYGELQYQNSTPFRIDYEHVDANSALSVLRDTSGRVKRRKERIGVGAATVSFNYTYDDQGRLWKVDGAVTSEYRYDNNGNRTYAKNLAGTLDGAGGNIVYNAQDQLTKYGDTNFEYTLKGDLYRRVGPEGTTTYDYDALGALRSVWLPDGRAIEYLVDGLGRRVAKKVNGALTKQWFYGGGMAPLAEADASGTIRMRFVYGSKANVPDVIKTYTAAGVADKLYRVASDQLGTPRVLFDSAGVIFKAMAFDEFGIKLNGAAGDTNPTFEIPFGFAGGLYDADTKLTRFGARDYDASVGRWVSKDPILVFGGINLYRYANNDPINFVDRSGRNPYRIALGGLVGGLYGAFHFAFTAPTDLCWGDAGRQFAGEVLAGAATGAAGELVEGGFLTQFIWNTVISAAGQGLEAGISGKAPGANEFLAKSLMGGLLSAAGSGMVTGFGGSETLEVVVEGALVGGAGADAGFWALEQFGEPGYFD